MKHRSSTSQRGSNPSITFIVLCIAVILLADQVSKQLVKIYVPLYVESGVSIEVLGNFFRIVHVENSALAFSLGSALPSLAKRLLYSIVPLVLVVLLGIMVFRDKKLSLLSKKAMVVIIGGGLGNIFDRIFRDGRVIDFLDVKFFGIFGLERWPTFNIADSTVVVGVFLFIISNFIGRSEQ